MLPMSLGPNSTREGLSSFSRLYTEHIAKKPGDFLDAPSGLWLPPTVLAESELDTYANQQVTRKGIDARDVRRGKMTGAAAQRAEAKSQISSGSYPVHN